MLGALFRRRDKRTALPKKNADYLIWRHVRNAGRTWQAQLATLQYPEAEELGQELRTAGILCDSSAAYLSEEGQSALTEASRLVLSMASDAMAKVKGPQTSKRKT